MIEKLQNLFGETFNWDYDYDEVFGDLKFYHHCKDIDLGHKTIKRICFIIFIKHEFICNKPLKKVWHVQVFKKIWKMKYDKIGTVSLQESMKRIMCFGNQKDETAVLSILTKNFPKILDVINKTNEQL